MGRLDHITIDGGEAGSEEEFERSIKSRNSQIFKLDEDDSITVRFLHEPYRIDDDHPGWYKYREHWTEEFGKFPCIGAQNDCPGCEESNTGSMRWLAAAVDTTDNKQVVVMLTQKLVQQLQLRYKKHGTIMDRDYELSRTGTGNTTNYVASPEAPVRRKLRYDVPDLKAILLRDTREEFRQFVGFEDGEAEKPRTSKKGATASKKPGRRPATVSRPRRRVADEDDEDEDDEDDFDEDDEDDDEPPARRVTRRPAKATKATVKTKTRRPVRR